MRIVAGKYRHRLIDYPNVESTRPTMDKVREAMMSSINLDIINRVVLDLFAGSGALGIESLSRGAKCCYFVDNNIQAVKTIKSNISNLKITEETHVCFSSYLDFLKDNKDKNFSLVFLDPPYKNHEVYDEILNFMIDNSMLSDDAIVVMEADYEMNYKPNFSSFRHYKYGMIHVNVYRR